MWMMILPCVHRYTTQQETPAIVVDHLMEEGASYQRSSVMVCVLGMKVKVGRRLSVD